MIAIQDVTVIKSGVKLFENFNLEIKANDHYVIGGPNGGGKTILLELIAGLIHPAKGEIKYDFIHGKSWEDYYWQRKRKIKFIHTHALQTLVPHSNELYYQQRYYADDKENTLRVKDILAQGLEKKLEFDLTKNLHIQSLYNVEITRLSNGQLKKVLLLKSLLDELPSMILLDYPFEGLDHSSREDLCHFIDWIATTYAIQILLVDQHHNLPTVIKKRLVIDNFNIRQEEQVQTISIPTESKKISQTKLVHREPIVEIKNLKIQYGEKVILNDFNWTIFPGERWALTGKNGAGKTTLLSMIFADHPLAYSQHVSLFGKRRGSGESIWDIKKRIIYVGPELISYMNQKRIMLTAKQYINSLNKKTDENKLTNLVQYFHADGFIEKAVQTLSSGQLQLMFIISSLLSDKELLLLDEPFQFLDGVQKERVSSYLQRQLNTDTTLILITHYEEEISNWTNLRKTI